MEHQNEYDEISLRELIEALLRQKKLIAIITTIAVILAGIYSFIILKPTYEAQMIIMASSINLRLENSDTNINVGNEIREESKMIEAYLEALTLLPTMSIETYRQQISAPEVISKTIDDLDIQSEFTVDELARKIVLETIKDTQLISIKLIDTDPVKASAIVNKLGDNFIEFVNNNSRERAQATSGYILMQMEKEEAIFKDLLTEQKELLSKPRVSSEVKMEIDALILQLTDYKTQINDLEIRTDELVAAIKTAQSLQSGGNSLILNQNTGRVTLDSSEKLMKIELAEINSRLDSIKTMIPELENKLEELRIEFEEKHHIESALSQKVNFAKQTYEAFSKKYEEIRVAESTQIGEASISIVSKAYPVSNPVGPNRALNMAIGLVLGLMLGVFAAFFIEYWKQTGEEKNKVA